MRRVIDETHVLLDLRVAGVVPVAHGRIREFLEEELEIALALGLKLENYFGVCETELAMSNLSFQKGDYAEALALLQKNLKKMITIFVF